MRISTGALTLAALWATSGLASAQSAPNIYPITSEIRDRGILDIASGRFLPRAAKVGANEFAIYDNTCPGSGGAFFTDVGPCEEYYDEGRIQQNWLPASSSANYPVTSLDITYCTDAQFGSVDIDVALFDTDQLGGVCIGGTPPPPGTLPLFEFSSSALGFPLPGSFDGTSLSCWIVTLQIPTPVSMSAAAGHGRLFNWSFRESSVGAHQNGPVLAGDPAVAPMSATFGMPAGFSSMGYCGSGLSTADSVWINSDNATGCSGSIATNCYWFGGYPTNPFASLSFRVNATSAAGCGSPSTYCTAKVNSQGCAPYLSSAGCPSVGIDEAFVVNAIDVLADKPGFFIYGTNGVQAQPFQGGFLCVAAPLARCAAQVTHTASGPCGGALTCDFNAQIQNGSDPRLSAGTTVALQAISRDPGASFKSSLTGGMTFTIAP